MEINLDRDGDLDEINVEHQHPVDDLVAVPLVGIQRRQSRWRSSWLALEHLGECLRSDALSFREADRMTNYLIIVSITLGVCWLLFPSHQTLAFLSSSCLGVTLTFYITQRLGILNTCTNRQTVLLAELMLSVFASGIYIATNCAAFTSFFRSLF